MAQEGFYEVNVTRYVYATSEYHAAKQVRESMCGDGGARITSAYLFTPEPAPTQEVK